MAPFGRGAKKEFERLGYCAGITTKIIEYTVNYPLNMIGFFDVETASLLGLQQPQQVKNDFEELLIGGANKRKIMETITPIMKRGGAKNIAIILMALCKLGYIHLPETGKEKYIYQPIITTFGLTKNLKSFASGINKVLSRANNNWQEKELESEINKQVKLLK